MANRWAALAYLYTNIWLFGNSRGNRLFVSLALPHCKAMHKSE